MLIRLAVFSHVKFPFQGHVAGGNSIGHYTYVIPSHGSLDVTNTFYNL